MANINFYLKPGTQNKSGEKSIVMRITYDSKRTVIFTGNRIHPRYWNQNRQLVRPPNQREPENNFVFINEALRVLRNKAEEALIFALKNNIALSDAFLKNWLWGNQTVKANKTFFEWLDEYIESGKPEKAPRTITGYITVRNFLKDFEKSTGYLIEMSSIDMVFFDKLKNYSYSERSIADNYFAKVISVLKSFLNWAKDREAQVSDTYSRFTAPEKEKEVIFLTLNELMILFNYNFTREGLNKARDLFCFGCFTGLRISDIVDLKKEHIIDGNIQKTIKKTRAYEIIPLNQFALQILDKYKKLNDRPLPRLSQPKINKYIKECCEIAGINSKVNTKRFSGGKVEEISLPKFKLITTHTARKTFLTNSIILGMNVMAAKGISGHKRDKNFMRYVKIAEDFKKKEMERTWGQLGKNV